MSFTHNVRTSCRTAVSHKGNIQQQQPGYYFLDLKDEGAVSVCVIGGWGLKFGSKAGLRSFLADFIEKSKKEGKRGSRLTTITFLSQWPTFLATQ